jgi:hypothetical protein
VAWRDWWRSGQHLRQLGRHLGATSTYCVEEKNGRHKKHG